MDLKEQEFQKRINATFRIEAEEHLLAFSSGLIELEKTQTQERLSEIIESMFREIHSLKGAARSVDRKEVEAICNPLESIFSALKHKELALSLSSFDLFFETSEKLSKLIRDSDSEQSTDERLSQKTLIVRLKKILTRHADNGDITISERNADSFYPEQAKVLPVIQSAISSETVRIKLSKLEPLLLQAEELIQLKKTINQRVSELDGINKWFTGRRNDSSKRKTSISLASKGQLNEWFDENEIYLNRIEQQLSLLSRSMERDQYNLDNMVENHLDSMREILMLPVSSIVETFPAMVREIARKQNKEIELIIRGAELEIDKRILEELKEPLIHMIRNSIDHGIEIQEERSLHNKKPRGTITLDFVAMESGIIQITISDDGRGIDLERVLKAAIKSGSLSGNDAERLAPEKIVELIYHSGVSASQIITDISGRGLGLSIVKEKVEKLNGKISVETELLKGTTFHILLPMTIATFRGILVRISEFQFILPTINVERVMKIGHEEIRTAVSMGTIRFDDAFLPVVDLGALLGLPAHKHTRSQGAEPGNENSDQVRLVVIFSGEQKLALMVDDVVDEQQVLVKGLGKLLKRVKNISGATILGTGKVVPVLNIRDLIKSSKSIKGVYHKPVEDYNTIRKASRILIAEDSITSRTLLKNILETAGYQVTTAVDGADAFTKARAGNFDLIVSDVDMPRVNGFELAAKIKHDKKLHEIPVVLVTALGSREDRERGVDAGAEAYIVKSNFDQTILLEIIRKLI
jgi:two-component system chemotaxis sensor kinase CheA